jgi:DNA-binding response OmpR family regulator
MSNIDILVIEDEQSIAEVLSLYLRRAGYEVEVVNDGQVAIDTLSQAIPDLIVLDLMLPNVNGIEITRWLRERSDVPIIMLTSRREETDRILGLEMGADDYVIKPFSPQELVSRVRAVLRRTHTQAQTTDGESLLLGELDINPQTRIVTVRGEEKNLTAKEFDLLWVLASQPRHVFTRNQLLEQVWGISDYIDPSTVTVHLRRLREKIELDASSPDHLLTVWGVGYKFEP